MSSKARLVITAVVVEKRPVAQVVRDVHAARNAARPATPPATVELVLRLRKQLLEAGLDAGADTIGWHLRHHNRVEVSRATIHRILTRHGAVVPDPAKRPRSSYIRFEAAQPNECWQSDFTHYRLPGGRDVEIITWLDDHSRYALHAADMGTSARTGASLPASRSTPSPSPQLSTATRLRPSPTTAWSTVSGWPHAAAGAPPWRPSYAATASRRKTADPTTPPPAERWSASNRR